jgi:DNA-binding PucR family transcriptional regulator
MWDSGEEGQRELVRSLYHYLLSGRNITVTAENIHVHRNSLIYRLNKLSEMLDKDLKDLGPDQTFFYLFSCMIVEHL